MVMNVLKINAFPTAVAISLLKIAMMVMFVPMMLVVLILAVMYFLSIVTITICVPMTVVIHQAVDVKTNQFLVIQMTIVKLILVMLL